MSKVKFCPLASGSNGNCTLVSIDNTAVLVDAGLSDRNIQKALAEINLDISKISAVFITHEHSDHIKSVGVLARRHKLPIFASKGTWRALNANRTLGEFDDDLKMVLAPNAPMLFGNIEVSSFNIPHDAAEPVGYTFKANHFKIGVSTDIGEPTDEIRFYLRGCDALLVESNHDLAMLRDGSYPMLLKRRIASPVGHLSNVAAGRLLAEVSSPRLRHVFLGHLSENNNRCDIAYNCVTNILRANGIDGTFKIAIAERYNASKPFVQ